MEQIKLSKLLQNNLKNGRGNYFMKFLMDQEIDIEKYSQDQIIFPYSERLKIVTYKKRGKLGEEKSNYLVMPESVFILVMADMESSGFHTSSIDLQGQGEQYIKASAGRGLISYDMVHNFLKNGFSFLSCVFKKENMFIGIDRFSRIWSNDLAVISMTGELIGSYLTEALKNFLIPAKMEYSEEKLLTKTQISNYSAEDNIVENIRARLGRKKINYFKKFRDGSFLIYAYTENKSSIMGIFYRNNILSIIPMESTDLNTMIEMSEIVEKSGGVFIGR